MQIFHQQLFETFTDGGIIEAVKVEFDPDVLGLNNLLQFYLKVFDFNIMVNP